MKNITQTRIRNKSQCTKIAIKWERLHSLGKISFLYYSSCGEQCCIQPFTWLLLSNTQFLSISLFSQMQTPGADPSFSSLFPTRIWWLQLGFGELALQGVLPWPFLFIWSAVFVSNLLLAKWIALKCIWAGHCSHPDISSADFSLGFSTSVPAPLTLQHSVFFVSSCPNIYGNISKVWIFFSLPR